MNTRKKFRFMLAIWGVFLFSGCLTLGPAKRSGFLVDYSSMNPDPNARDVLFYQNPKFPSEEIVQKYLAFMIDPIAVYFHPNVIGRAVKPDDLKALTDYFQRELALGLNERFFVVDTPGPNVARIRIAVTGVSASHFRLTVHPTLAAVDLQHAGMELELIDTKTADRIVALMDLRPRGEYTKFDDMTIRKHSQAVIDAWITEILLRLNAVFKVPAPPPDPAAQEPMPPVLNNDTTEQIS